MLKNIKILRKEIGISQQALADAIGVSQQSVNKYENHNIEPDIETLKRIADYFKTSIDYIVGYSNLRNKIEVTYKYSLNDKERDLIDKFRKLKVRHQQTVMRICDDFLDQ